MAPTLTQKLSGENRKKRLAGFGFAIGGAVPLVLLWFIYPHADFVMSVNRSSPLAPLAPLLDLVMLVLTPLLVAALGLYGIYSGIPMLVRGLSESERAEIADQFRNDELVRQHRADKPQGHDAIRHDGVYRSPKITGTDAIYYYFAPDGKIRFLASEHGPVAAYRMMRNSVSANPVRQGDYNCQDGKIEFVIDGETSHCIRGHVLFDYPGIRVTARHSITGHEEDKRFFLFKQVLV